jgi:CO/xanthine dehydrogenase Mo-binding subunit
MATALAQIAAEALSCPVELVRVLAADTSRVPDSGPTGSGGTVMSGNAILDAAARIRAAMDPIVADSGLSWREAVAACAKNQVALAAFGWAAPPPTTFDLTTGQGEPYIGYSFSATVAEVEVDMATGETRVLRVHSAHDAGRVVNPTAAEGQVEGGVVQGLGYALFEEHAFRDGHILNHELSTYILPTAVDAPEMRTSLVEHAHPWGPYGAKALGEATITAVAPAVTAAVASATGTRVNELPATPERIWNAIRERRG